MKFTPAAIAALKLPADKSEALVFDDDLPGLGIRIRGGGTRTWIFRYRVGRAVRRMTIGNADVVSLSRARQSAADLHARVHLGADPAREKAENRIRAADTMATALAAYIPYQKSRLKPLSLKQCERHLIKHCRSLHALALSTIDRRTVASKMAALVTKSGPGRVEQGAQLTGRFLRLGYSRRPDRFQPCSRRQSCPRAVAFENAQR
jgi:hypothetical protein